MLLCGDGGDIGCDRAYHTGCLFPPLQSVPEGDWLCPECSTNDTEEKSEEKSEETAGNESEGSLRCVGTVSVCPHFRALLNTHPQITPCAVIPGRCEVCGRADCANTMLLCGDGDETGCDDAYHMGCLDPVLLSVPVGDWLCPNCSSL